MIRRGLDVVIAGAALAVLGVPLLVICVLIRLGSRGSPIYRQRRVGKDGKEFDVLKLRTMVHGAEHIGAGIFIDDNDSRITKLGWRLREWSIDELPQLVNVLRGDMSLIGPRPTIPAQVADYTERQRGRLAVRPGLTGWAQVSGRASIPWAERIELDLWYLEHRSLRLDLKILWRSVKVVLGREHTYHSGDSREWPV